MSEPSRLKRIQDEVVASASDDVSMLADPARTPWHRAFIHFWTLVGTFFWRNRCQVRASALAYTTLLALVPLLAVSISMLVVFKSNDAESRINDWIEQLVQHVAPTLGLSDQKDGDSARHVAVKNIVDFVGKIRFGTIGVTAMAGLVFAAISLMRTIEAAFNDIWGVSKSRSWWNSILLYWGVMTLGPAVMAIVTTRSANCRASPPTASRSAARNTRVVAAVSTAPPRPVTAITAHWSSRSSPRCLPCGVTRSSKPWAESLSNRHPSNDSRGRPPRSPRDSSL